MLVARIRLLLATLLLLIPVVSLWYEQEPWENLVGLPVTVTAFLVAADRPLFAAKCRGRNRIVSKQSVLAS